MKSLFFKRTFSRIIVLVALGAFLLSNVFLVNADLQIQRLTSNLNFMGNDVDSKGTLWAGDKNFTLWKSSDNGASFQLSYNLPHDNPLPYNPNPYSGLVWTVFVDSRDYVFVSGGGARSALYRSTDGGATFSSVLNANDTSNRSFYISMTEDNQTNLYAATYTIAVGIAQPQLLKSTNGGTTWSRIGSFSLIHFHTVKFNPYNGYLYAIAGERSGSLYSCNDSEKIFRSKDFGATWSLVIDRNDTLGTVYLPMSFVGNYVYVGQDYPNRNCQIHRFYDDGKGPFVPQIVYTPPNDGFMPFVSSTYFNDTLMFGNCAESQNGTSRIVTSTNGVDWGVLQSSPVNLTDIRWNFFTTHPSTIIFGTIQTGYSYQIQDVPPPPTPAPIPIETAQPAANPTTRPIDLTAKTQTPKPTEIQPTPTLTSIQNSSTSKANASTPEASPTMQSLSNPSLGNLNILSPLAGGIVIGTVIFGVLCVTAYTKRKNRKRV